MSQHPLKFLNVPSSAHLSLHSFISVQMYSFLRRQWKFFAHLIRSMSGFVGLERRRRAIAAREAVLSLTHKCVVR
jgi:hypothetical protein